MSFFSSPRFLGNVLLADTASCLACGGLQVALAGGAARLFGLSSPLLLGTGLFLLVYAAAVAFIATRDAIPRPLVWLLVLGNLGWAVRG